MIKKLILSITTVSLLLSAQVLACPKNKGMSQTYKGKTRHALASNVVNAVSKTGLSAEQTLKIADGVADYKITMRHIKQMRIFPIDSFINDNFDEKIFIKEMSLKSESRIAAQAALFKFVFSVLNEEQRKTFKREYAAPLIEKMIHMNIAKTQGTMQNKMKRACNK
ncbi:MAG: hypothetical protein GQ570_00300 [Helicobacteraceae bacterium]|nr:hypothetical protein [Helicobacteraceae bacterium]